MVETAPPLLSTGVRFLVAGILLYGWLLARGGARGWPCRAGRRSGPRWSAR